MEEKFKAHPLSFKQLKRYAETFKFREHLPQRIGIDMPEKEGNRAGLFATIENGTNLRVRLSPYEDALVHKWSALLGMSNASLGRWVITRTLEELEAYLRDYPYDGQMPEGDPEYDKYSKLAEQLAPELRRNAARGYRRGKRSE